MKLRLFPDGKLNVNPESGEGSPNQASPSQNGGIGNPKYVSFNLDVIQCYKHTIW